MVGFRRGAFRAAQKLGIGIRLIHNKPLPNEICDEIPPAHRRHVDFEDAPAAAIQLATGIPLQAVMATGEGAVLPSAQIRAQFGLPGNDLDTALCCADKAVMKRAVNAAGIATTPWRAIDIHDNPVALADELVSAFGLPVVLKQAQASGSRGQLIAHDRDTLLAGLQTAETTRENSHGLLAEQFVTAQEMSVESFVSAGNIEFVNCTSYVVRGHASLLPAPLTDQLKAAVFDLNARAIAALGVERGMTHLEVYLTDKGPLFGELAIRPPGGRIMQLIARGWGFSPWQAAIELELGRRFKFPQTPKRTVAAWLLHPGPGRLASVRGIEAAQKMPLIRRVVCRVGEGDLIGPRLGTGQDVGYLEAEGDDPQALVRALHAAHAALVFEFDALARPPTYPGSQQSS